jgi:hypothetical protein
VTFPHAPTASPTQAGPNFARRFPVKYLPPNMRDYVVDIAERKMVPVDMPALFMLGILSSVTASRIQVRRDRDWTEPTNLYGMVGMRSGAAKTPVVRELSNGLGKAKKLLGERHQQDLARRQADLAAEIDNCLAKANDIHTSMDEKTGLKARVKDLQKEAELLAQKPPKPPLIVVDGDTTPEALAERMAANGGHVAVIDDEGPLIRNLGGQYSGKTANLAVLLKAYDGQAYYPSRITRDAAAMDRAILTIAISPQPGLVAEMLRNTLMDETGLINRFVVSLPGDLIGKRQGRPSTFIDDVPTVEDRRLQQWWANLLETVAEHDVLTGDPEADAFKILDLTRGAWKLHYDYQEAFEPRMDADRGGDLAGIIGWASKHCGRILRFAALLHVGAGYTLDDRIEESTMRCAIGIGEWALEHFLHLGKVIGLSESAGRIKEYIDGKELPFASRTEINVEVFRKNVPSDQLTAWLDELVATGRYEWASIPTEGRPKKVIRKVPAVSEVPCAA